MKQDVIYGYVRVSTMNQSYERQITNIKKLYPEAIIFSDSFTGTKMDRPNWNKLVKQLRSGDIIVFDEVSRMSRNAEEGFQTYKELYDMGITLIFLKESTLNTDNFKKTIKKPIESNISTGRDIIDKYVNGNFELLNELLMGLAEEQIKTAFETAQHEVDFLHMRIGEGMKQRGATNKYKLDDKENKILDDNGKPILVEQGSISRAKTGVKLTTKKSIKAKETIKEHSKDFGGTLTDLEVMKLTGLARNTYYKYKKELKTE